MSTETSPKRESEPGEGAGGDTAAGGEETAAGPGPSDPKKTKPEEPADQQDRDEVENPVEPIMYELVGVVVHSGQANAGHYYSFIMDRKSVLHMVSIYQNYINTLFALYSARKLGKKRWIKFNDNLVEECHFTDEVVQNECFGGEYKAKFYDIQGNMHIQLCRIIPILLCKLLSVPKRAFNVNSVPLIASSPINKQIPCNMRLAITQTPCI